VKKVFLFAVAALLLFSNAAMADSIAGKVGITARGGLSYIFNSKLTVVDSTLDKIERSKAWAAGSGIMYGITDNLAVDFDVIYSQADCQVSDGTTSINLGMGKNIDFALGAQWRFMPKNAFVPYVGVGFDVFWNKIDINGNLSDLLGSADIAVTYGGHLSAGVDCFLTPNIALNAEIRGVYSTDGDLTIKSPGEADVVVGKYNPTNISGFVGIRFLFL
jgi:outer membrane protein